MKIEIGDVIFVKGVGTNIPFVLEVIELLKERFTKVKLLYTNSSNYEIGDIINAETKFLKKGFKLTEKELKSVILLYF